jgi:hypothetical protein
MTDQKVWATTAETGFPLEEEEEEMRNEVDDWEGKTTVRFLHPVISNLTQHLNGKEHIGHNLTRIPGKRPPPCQGGMTPQMGKQSPPPRARDPPRIKDHQDKKLRLGTTFLLDHPRPNTTEHGIIHVEVE